MKNILLNMKKNKSSKKIFNKLYFNYNIEKMLLIILKI